MLKKLYCIVGLLLTFTVTSFSTQAHMGEYKSNRISYGFEFSSIQNPLYDLTYQSSNIRVAKDENITTYGGHFRYHYHPKNSVDFQALLSFDMGKTDTNTHSTSPAIDIKHAIAELELRLGYNFFLEMISFAPYIGRMGYAFRTRLESQNTRADIDIVHGATVFGLLTEFLPDNPLTIGVDLSIAITDNGEIKIDRFGIRTDELNGATILRIHVPIDYKFSDNFGLRGGFEYISRKFEEKSSSNSHKVNAWKAKVGLQHYF